MQIWVTIGDQSAGLIHEILPAAAIVAQLVADAESHLNGAPRLLT